MLKLTYAAALQMAARNRLQERQCCTKLVPRTGARIPSANDKIADNKALCSESSVDRWDSWRTDAQKN